MIDHRYKFRSELKACYIKRHVSPLILPIEYREEIYRCVRISYFISILIPASQVLSILDDPGDALILYHNFHITLTSLVYLLLSPLFVKLELCWIYNYDMACYTKVRKL